MLFVATPMFGAQCAGIFADSMCRLMDQCAQRKLRMSYRFYYNSSLVTAARTLLANEFMRSSATHLLFIDADIGFDPTQVFELLDWQEKISADVIGGIYPKKNIRWEIVEDAVQRGVPADELHQFTSHYPVKLADASWSGGDQPVQAEYIGAGFMLISRKALSTFAGHYPSYVYGQGSNRRVVYFQAEVQDDSYISEDVFFCKMIRKAGGTVWCCPWIKLRHFGNHVYGGPPPEFI